MRIEYIQAEDHPEAHNPRDQNPLNIFSLKVTGDVMEPSLSSMLNQMIHVRSAVQKMKLPTSDSLQNTGMTKSKEMLKTTLQIFQRSQENELVHVQKYHQHEDLHTPLHQDSHQRLMEVLLARRMYHHGCH